MYPFTLTRSFKDIRLGILTIGEKNLPQHLHPAQPWQIFLFNDEAIRLDFELICKGRHSQKISSTNSIISPDQVFVEEGAVVEHCIINASNGPVYIGRGTLIMEGTLIRGPVAICEGSVVKMGSRIYGGTTIGPNCIAGGEIKNSVMFGNSNKAHDGYLGDSVIGEWCNLGAGTSNSNVKNSAGDVKIWDAEQQAYVIVGKKCGLIMGDYSRCSINTTFNTGTVVGISCNIFGSGFPPKYVPDFTWGAEEYDLEKALRDIDNWKQLKGSEITENENELLRNIYLNKKIRYA